MDKRIRSPNYPALSLREAIDKIGILYKNLHTHAAPREVVAKGMGYNSLNGASATAISALHKYGLLDRAGDDIKLSDRAMRILHPHSPEERADAVREAASEPKLFAELAERFPGAMPNEELLRNYLLRQGFAPGAVSSVILAYRDTVELVGREPRGYDSPVSSPEARPQMNIPAPAQHAAQPQVLALPQGDSRSLGRHDFDDGRFVQIIAGGGIDTKDALKWAEKLIAFKRDEFSPSNAPSAVAHQPSAGKQEDEHDA